MKRRFLATIALVLVFSMTLSGCAALDFVKDFFQSNFGEEIALTDAPLNAQKVIDFANGADKDVFFESDGWSNGDVFNVVWKSSNVKYADGIMSLGITEEKASAYLNDQEVEFDYTAGEARSQNYYHYGDYAVSMKPSANPGTASTFFICTGPYDTKIVDGVAVPNPHDEIDIEFLGKDTTHVQFNFFVNGVGGNEFMFDLGFDASEEFHEYGFRWEETAITWFVDGKPVYKVTTDTTATEGKNVRIVEALPQTAGRMLGNYWCGNERAWGWMGQYKGNVNDDGCQYQWIATSAVGAPLNPPTDDPATDAEINWAEIAPIAPTFPSAEKYVVTIDGNKANVTYTDVGGSDYKNIEMDVTNEVAGKNYVYMKVTNNGTETVNVRVNMFDPTLTGDNKATNISATMNGESVNTDLVWGGSFFDIPAGETAELVVHFGVGGVKLQLMIDSSKNDAVLRSGDITVEDIKFAAVGEVEAPCQHTDADGDAKCDNCGEDMVVPPSPPENPVSGNVTLNFGDFTTDIKGNTADGYGVNVDENNNISVEYTNIVGNSYKNFWADVSAIAGTKNIFSAKITNMGTENVKLRVDIESQTQVTANTTACNLSATMDGVAVFTDLEWGGSVFEIPVGATVTIEVVYDASKLPTNVKIMVDSCQWDDSTTHAGNIVITDLAFSGEYIPEEGGDPVTPPADTDLKLNFWTSSDNYTVDGNNIKYNGAGNAYSCAGADIAALATGNNTFTVTITNNGSSASRVRVDIQATNPIGNHNVCNVSAVGGDVWTDMEWGGSSVTVPAGESVTLVITYDENTDRGAVTNLVIFLDAARGDDATYNSDITLSGMAFSKVGGEEPKPEQPVVGEYLSFNGNLDTYTLSATPDQYVNTLQVTYTAASTNTWHNINAYVLDKAAGKTTAGVTICNNGAETVKITIKLETDGTALGEKKVEVAPGATETFFVDYSADATLLFFFIDSDWSETTTTHAGDITISGIHFK